ncbi:MAG: Tat pathway signal protein, partial [Gemmatimonadetes bacterium]|nr:Tat pathway signal protein [Gemmatimonadota bacterium]
MNPTRTRTVVALSILLGLNACGPSGNRDSHAPRDVVETSPGSAKSPPGGARAEQAFLSELQERTFRFFWETTDPATGLAPDRWPTRSFASVAATGFALTSYPIGVEHGWVTRAEAAVRTRDTLRFLWEAPQGPEPAGTIGYHGLFYHFLDPATGVRYRDVELSTVDTALLLAGALFAREYFDSEAATEAELRSLADSLYARADWNWASPRPPALGHGWDPESGHLPYDWRGYNEAMILYLLALGSPTHAVPAEAWNEWSSRYHTGEFQGETYLGFAPMFGHQYSHVFVDFRGVHDRATRDLGFDYFENSVRAARAQHAYAVENPQGFAGYGDRLWGLTACDGPVEGKFAWNGRSHDVHTYWARGACFTGVNDDGTVSPTAAAASVAFVPDLVTPTLVAMQEDFGENLFGRYG